MKSLFITIIIIMISQACYADNQNQENNTEALTIESTINDTWLRILRLFNFETNDNTKKPTVSVIMIDP